MIFWGSRGRTFKQAQGNFNCPTCLGDQSYKHQKVEKWFTLYFLPLFPTKTIGEYIECDVCKSTFNLEVLEYDPEKEVAAFHAEFAIATLNVMCKIALGDGEIDPSEMNEIYSIYKSLTGVELSEEEIEGVVDVIRNDSMSIADYATHMSGTLNDKGKCMIVSAACRMSKADGDIDDEEVKLIHELAGAMALSKSLVNDLLQEEGIPAI